MIFTFRDDPRTVDDTNIYQYDILRVEILTDHSSIVFIRISERVTDLLSSDQDRHEVVSDDMLLLERDCRLDN